MGAAKRRGSFGDRLAQAHARTTAAELAQRELQRARRASTPGEAEAALIASLFARKAAGIGSRVFKLVMDDEC